ncbi:DUF2726 domain-containing protein [Alkalimonas sp. NCh-2]|uniref:DUF2726 domain-containing protein n=1 Tax=Alkalimonas sp. NCh-2 TaxID=3144846 RepID=UPI0031F632FC
MEFVLLLLVALVVVAALVASRFVEQGNPFPFQKRGPIFTSVERGFLRMLEQAVDNEYKVLSRVKLADVLEFKKNTSSKTKRTALLKMNNKYLDFVLCDPNDMSIVAVIDLVNQHSKQGHKASHDWYVSGALEAAGLPYLRMKIKQGYSIGDIQQCLISRLGATIKKTEPLIKGRFKKGPTRPVRPMRPVMPAANPSDTIAALPLKPTMARITPGLSQSQIKAQSTALVQAS